MATTTAPAASSFVHRVGPPSAHHPHSFQNRQRQRTSVEGAVPPSFSTTSPFESPVSPDFPPEAGLAPRPPSFPYGAQPGDPAVGRSRSKRRREPPRGSLGVDPGLDVSPPPAAPEAPRPPPLSYKPSPTHDLEREDSRNHAGPSTVPVAQQPRDAPVRAGARQTSGRDTTRRRSTGGHSRGKPPTDSQPLNGSTRQRRDWAPDRSPLQKLELTLHDITKEEKRAQVEEAELLAREAKAGRGTRKTPSAKVNPSPEALLERKAREADHLAEAGLVRALSNKQKDMIQRSATVESQEPFQGSSARVSHGRGFEYHEQQYVGEAAKASQGPARPPSDATSWDLSDQDVTPPTRRRSESKAHQVLGTNSSHAMPLDVNARSRLHGPSHLAMGAKTAIARLTAADIDLSNDSLTATAPETRDTAWWERDVTGKAKRGQSRAKEHLAGGVPPEGLSEDESQPTLFRPPLYLKCGPLLRYTGIRRSVSMDSVTQEREPHKGGREFWRGSVMIVTADASSSYSTPPKLRLFAQPVNLLPPPPVELEGEDIELPPEHVDPISGLPKLMPDGRTVFVKPVEHLEEGRDASHQDDHDDELFEQSRSPAQIHGNHWQKFGRPKAVHGESLGKYQEVDGLRLHAEKELTFWRFHIEVELGQAQARIAYRINRGPPIGFWVPARGAPMNIMFSTGNGFGLNVDTDALCGLDPLWRDVLNSHQSRPFHVMIGGGDQLYNDAVTRETTFFREWLQLRDQDEKYSEAFSSAMKEELELFYLNQYTASFSRGLFSMANSQIPSVNVWGDHDIIDGWGSYPEHFNSSPVLKGLGAIAFKYYLLFQHQTVVAETEAEEPSWLLGASLGPYIEEPSRNLFMFLGGVEVAFLGLDCRVERTRESIIRDETYDLVFSRLRREIVKGATKHLIVLLGVPVAYPRMMWLETILTSRMMGPVKVMGKSGMLGGLINKLDGGVEVLDDLDDHWTARNHKAERNWIIQELQDLAEEKSVRVTILSGDVQLAAVGQFYSKSKFGLPKDRDYRYIPNIVSSAIANAPPPDMIADALNKRDKVHSLDEETEESMIPLFTHDIDGSPRNNKRLLPRRNWCSIRLYQPGSTPPPTPTPPATPLSQEMQLPPGKLTRTFSLSRSNTLPVKLLRRMSTRGSTPDARTNNGPRTEDSSAPLPLHSDGYFPPQPEIQGEVFKKPEEAPPRPGIFHRQTTSFLEGKEKPRIGGGGDATGHINLEHGLEIVLNAEVNPKDPAGITTPYRLLVPALWHKGVVEDGVGKLKRDWMSWSRRASMTPDMSTESPPASIGRVGSTKKFNRHDLRRLLSYKGPRRVVEEDDDGYDYVDEASPRPQGLT
ncbi:MAG: hypothetical protein M1833_005913 [Piccolia ochrophora]|nr:MAG: hypothetical protein M1833_005913 [Piccolia ochrophora]